MPGPLINRDAWKPLFDELRGKRVGVVDGDGNAGDRLLYSATRQLLNHFGIQWRTVNVLADPVQNYKNEVDLLLVFAGGAIGGWRPVQLIRKYAIETKIPCIQLPCTYINFEDLSGFKKVYVRETHSLKHNPKAEVLPDLALGFNFPPPLRKPYVEKVLSLRTDASKYPEIKKKFDATAHCYTVEDYLHMTSRFRWIVTDRLHLAIIGLGLGRRVTLLPHFHNGNKAMWEHSLKDLGCEWEDSPTNHLNTPRPTL
jgi:exopolysaccharide biosynthesis predicted pyruvyltransferase EpsI